MQLSTYRAVKGLRRDRLSLSVAILNISDDRSTLLALWHRPLDFDDPPTTCDRAASVLRSSFVRIAGPKRVLSVLLAGKAALLVVLIFPQEIRHGLALEFVD